MIFELRVISVTDDHLNWHRIFRLRHDVYILFWYQHRFECFFSRGNWFQRIAIFSLRSLWMTPFRRQDVKGYNCTDENRNSGWTETGQVSSRSYEALNLKWAVWDFQKINQDYFQNRYCAIRANNIFWIASVDDPPLSFPSIFRPHNSVAHKLLIISS